MRLLARRTMLLQLLVLLCAYLATAHAGTATTPPGGGLTQLAGEAGCFHQQNPDEEDELKSCADGKGILGADAVAVSPDGRNVYVASRGEGNLLTRGSNGVAAFARDSRGRLTQIGCITNNGSDGREGTDGACQDGDALSQADWVTVSPDGRNVYATASDGGVATFRRSSSGRLTQIGCYTDAPLESRCKDGYALYRPTSAAVSPDGRNVYVTARGKSAVITFARDPETGDLTQTGCTSDDGSDGACANGTALEGVSGVTVSPDGAHAYVTAGKDGAVAVFARDQATGALTQTSCNLYAAPADSSCAKASGLADATEAEVSPDGRFVYVTAIRSEAVSVFARDGSSGALREVQCISEAEEDGCTAGTRLSFATAVEITSDGRRVYVTDAGGSALTAYTADRSTGRLTPESCVEEDPLGPDDFEDFDDEEDEEGEEDQEEEDAPEPLLCANAHAIFGAKGLALSPDDQNAYVAADTGNSLAAFGTAIGVRTTSARAFAGGLVSVEITCPAGRPHGCAGTLELAGGRSGTHAGSGAFRAQAGDTARVRVLLTRRARAQLARRRSVRLRLTVHERSSLALPSSRMLLVRGVSALADVQVRGRPVDDPVEQRALVSRQAAHRLAVDRAGRVDQRALDRAPASGQVHLGPAGVDRVGRAGHQAVALHPPERRRHRRLLDRGDPGEGGLGQPVALVQGQHDRKLARRHVEAGQRRAQLALEAAGHEPDRERQRFVGLHSLLSTVP